MQQQTKTENKTNATYETLGDPLTIRLGKQDFLEVVHKRAHLPGGEPRDFVMIARGFIMRDGRKRTQRLVTIPAEHAGAVAAALAAPERNLDTIALELEA